MIVKLLDAKTLGQDLNYQPLEEFGQFESYDYTSSDEMIDRSIDVEVLISNKIQYTREVLMKLPKLRLICLTSTGTNTVDLPAAKEMNIVVKNILHYSTPSVVQLTYSMLFRLMVPLNYYDKYVKSGSYINDFDFGHYEKTWHELSGKTFGIVGLGNIGKQVGQIARLFGAKVIYYSTSGKNKNNDFEQVTFDDLLTRSDIISIHAPLNEDTRYLFDMQAFNKMKRTSILLNLGRGPIVNEKDLVEALNSQLIIGAGLDVLEHEPMVEGHPINQLHQSEKLIVTPHIGWASLESRQRMLKEVKKNIRSYIEGTDYQTVV